MYSQRKKSSTTFMKIIFMFSLLFNFLPEDVFAQDFEVSPVILGFQVDPGNIETRRLTIRNYSNKKQTFEFKLSDYLVDDKGEQKPIPAGSSKNSLSEWISITPAILELNPNEVSEIDVVLTVPSSGTDARWGVIGAKCVQEKLSFEVDKKSMGAGVIISPRIAIQVTQTPKSSMDYKATIKNLVELTKPEDKQRSFQAEIVNTGPLVINAKVFLTLANLSTAEERRFPEEKMVVYPGATRKVILKLPSDIAKGKFALAALLDYGHGTSLEGVQLMIEQK